MKSVHWIVVAVAAVIAAYTTYRVGEPGYTAISAGIALLCLWGAHRSRTHWVLCPRCHGNGCGRCGDTGDAFARRNGELVERQR